MLTVQVTVCQVTKCRPEITTYGLIQLQKGEGGLWFVLHIISINYSGCHVSEHIGCGHITQPQRQNSSNVSFKGGSWVEDVQGDLIWTEYWTPIHLCVEEKEALCCSAFLNVSKWEICPAAGSYSYSRGMCTNKHAQKQTCFDHNKQTEGGAPRWSLMSCKETWSHLHFQARLLFFFFFFLPFGRWKTASSDTKRACLYWRVWALPSVLRTPPHLWFCRLRPSLRWATSYSWWG